MGKDNVMEWQPINKRHRYLIKRNSDREYVGSTDDLGMPLPTGHTLVDTIGEDGLGTVNGNKGISDFLRAEVLGRRP
jgi:hypothetical protein